VAKTYGPKIAQVAAQKAPEWAEKALRPKSVHRKEFEEVSYHHVKGHGGMADLRRNTFSEIEKELRSGTYVTQVKHEFVPEEEYRRFEPEVVYRRERDIPRDRGSRSRGYNGHESRSRTYDEYQSDSRGYNGHGSRSRTYNDYQSNSRGYSDSYDPSYSGR
jgi:hypothetical protein